MSIPPIPPDEPARLRLLRACDVLDTPPEPAFDDLVDHVAWICDTPMATVTLIDEDRQWFESRKGIAVSETPRDLAFCAYAILEEGLLIVPDATRDPRFADNALVTGPPGIRFYAGAPIRVGDGSAVGTVAVMDTVPRELDADHLRALQTIAGQVTALLEARRALADQRERLVGQVEEELRRSDERLEQAFVSAPQGIALLEVRPESAPSHRGRGCGSLPRRATEA